MVVWNSYLKKNTLVQNFYWITVFELYNFFFNFLDHGCFKFIFNFVSLCNQHCNCIWWWTGSHQKSESLILNYKINNDKINTSKLLLHACMYQLFVDWWLQIFWLWLTNKSLSGPNWSQPTKGLWSDNRIGWSNLLNLSLSHSIWKSRLWPCKLMPMFLYKIK